MTGKYDIPHFHTFNPIFMRIPEVLPQFKHFALNERGLKSNSIREILSTSKSLSQAFSNPTLKSISTAHIREFLYQRKAERMWTNKTFRNRRQQLKTFFDFCLSREFILSNPVIKIEKPKVPKQLPRCLDKAQLDKLICAVDNYTWYNQLEEYRNKAIIRTFYLTGVRLSELLNLKTNSVNFSESEIKILLGKGGKDRIIPIHPNLMPYLKAYHLLKKKKPTEYFFSSLRSDKPLTTKNLYAILKKLRKKIDFHFTPHMLRHTFGKLSIESNLNPFKLQILMGHASISTTQIYVYVSNHNLKESFQKLQLP